MESVASRESRFHEKDEKEKMATNDVLSMSCSPSPSTTVSGESSPESARSSRSGMYREEPPMLLPEDRAKPWCTDAEIAGCKRNDGERELKQWEPLPDDVLCADEQELDVCTRSRDKQDGNGAWDQFKANAELFGVVSSFQNDLSQYTTPLDVTKIPRAIRDKADRLAKEIESNRKTNNLDAGIGCDCDDNEEAHWSAVPRNGIARSNYLLVGLANRFVEGGIGCATHPEGRKIIDQGVERSMLASSDPTSDNGTECTLSSGASSMTTTPPDIVCEGPLSLHPGTQIMIHGLIRAPAFNGRGGIVESFDAESGRYNIRLLDTNQLAKIKKENLHLIPPESNCPIYQ
jgi:PAB1-binding protein PBP1